MFNQLYRHSRGQQPTHVCGPWLGDPWHHHASTPAPARVPCQWTSSSPIGCSQGSNIICKLHVDEGIPTILGNRHAVNTQHQLFHRWRDSPATVLRVVERCRSEHPLQKLDSRLHLYTSNSHNTLPPSLYLLNAAGLAKPHAIEHLAADLVELHRYQARPQTTALLWLACIDLAYRYTVI